MAPRPSGQVCPFHADEQPTPVFVNTETVEWELTCERQDHVVAGPYAWAASSGEGIDFGGSLGLDLKQSLAAAVRSASDEHGGGWVEYGLVERAFALSEPGDWAVLLAKYDHRYYYGDTGTRGTLPYTASKYLAGRLGALSRLGDVRYSSGKGTGYWDYLARVSCWTAPGREASKVMSSYSDADVAMSEHMPTVRPH